MNNLEYIANCRIIFYKGMNMCLDIPIFLSDELEEMIMNYSIQSFSENYNAIKSIYCYEYKRGNYSFSFPEELIELIQSKIAKMDNPKEMIKIYDAVGFEKTEELTNFAAATCDYISEIFNAEPFGIKQ